MEKNSQEKYFALAKRVNYSDTKKPLDKWQLLLDELIKSSKEDKYRHFFEAEKAFLNGLYKKALKGYLMAKGVEDIAFYCYRCNAFIYFQAHRLSESLNSLKKALSIHPDDQSSLALAENIKKNLYHSPSSATPQTTPPEPALITPQSIDQGSKEPTPIPLESLKQSDFLKKWQLNKPSPHPNKPEDLFLNEDELQSFDTPNLYLSPEQIKLDNLDLEDKEPYSQKIEWGQIENFNFDQDPLDFSLFEEKEGHWQSREWEDWEAEENWEEWETQEKKRDPLPWKEDKKEKLPWAKPPLAKQNNISSQSSLKPQEKSFLNSYWQLSPLLPHPHLLTFTHPPQLEHYYPQLIDKLLPLPRQEGLFFIWNEVGIALNPSLYFLENLAEKGFSLKNIQHIFFNPDIPQVKEYVESLYTLHAKASSLSTLQLYPLKPSPSFSKVKLSPCIDQSKLSPHIDLYTHRSPSSSLCLRFQLNKQEGETSNSIGWVAPDAIEKSSIDFFHGCDCLILDLSKTHDPSPSSPTFEMLRFFLKAFPKTLCLLSHPHPSLHPYLFEWTQQLRRDIHLQLGTPPLLFPSTANTWIELEKFQIMCHESGAFYPSETMKILSSPLPSKKLRFISENLFV